MAHAGSSKSSRHYKRNSTSAARKRVYDRAYRKREKGSLAPDGPKKKAMNRAGAKRWAERKKRGIAGKGGPDISHLKSGKVTTENRTKNRGRNGKNGKSTKK